MFKRTIVFNAENKILTHMKISNNKWLNQNTIMISSMIKALNTRKLIQYNHILTLDMNH